MKILYLANRRSARRDQGVIPLHVAANGSVGEGRSARSRWWATRRSSSRARKQSVSRASHPAGEGAPARKLVDNQVSGLRLKGLAV